MVVGFQGPSLSDIVNRLELYPNGKSIGPDIDLANEEILSVQNHDLIEKAFRKWAARFQPCLFGRIGSRSANGVSYDFVTIDEHDIECGDIHLINTIQDARRGWKKRALDGGASALLIFFKHTALARAKPGPQILEVCQKVSNLYLLEHSPVASDVIYTEAIPLRIGNDINIFKAGVNVFYGGAHQTLNHDRRIPGGVLISVNSPGHLASALVMNGHQPGINEAVRFVYETAMHSVGNGGQSWGGGSSTWHNSLSPNEVRASTLSLRKCPHHIPEDYSGSSYSAMYHTDVLIPHNVTVASPEKSDAHKAEVWKWLSMDYISHDEVNGDSMDEWFAPEKINEEAIYHNPWKPLRAVNSKNFIY